MEVRGYPSGTSTVVGPAFFPGQNTELGWNRSFQETANILRLLGWLGLGTAVLFIVGTLEWQTWHRPTFTAGSESVAVAQGSVQSGSRADWVPPSPSVATTAIPSSARKTAGASTQPKIPASAGVAPTVQISSTVGKLESARNETLEQQRVADDSARMKLLRAAMGKGDADAPVSLANIYLEGKEVSRSCDKALRLLESAAVKPNVRARNRLAAMYEIGSCVQRDRVQAYRWLNSALAIDGNNSWAQQNRDQTWRQMTVEERTIAEADR